MIIGQAGSLVVMSVLAVGVIFDNSFLCYLAATEVTTCELVGANGAID